MAARGKTTGREHWTWNTGRGCSRLRSGRQGTLDAAARCAGEGGGGEGEGREGEGEDD